MEGVRKRGRSSSLIKVIREGESSLIDFYEPPMPKHVIYVSEKGFTDMGNVIKYLAIVKKDINSLKIMTKVHSREISYLKKRLNMVEEEILGGIASIIGTITGLALFLYGSFTRELVFMTGGFSLLFIIVIKLLKLKRILRKRSLWGQ